MKAGIIGLAIEVVFLGIGSLIYFSGFGTGPQGAVPMVAGIAVAVIGLLIGGILGLTGMTKGGGNSFASVLATMLPLVILAVVFIRRIGPL
jgi:hypothetical protein